MAEKSIIQTKFFLESLRRRKQLYKQLFSKESIPDYLFLRNFIQILIKKEYQLEMMRVTAILTSKLESFLTFN
jgi:hypothetical protein